MCLSSSQVTSLICRIILACRIILGCYGALKILPVVNVITTLCRTLMCYNILYSWQHKYTFFFSIIRNIFLKKN